ncbi:MAG: ankyrin repeat domain-containing protein [Noviherbaspirillum sp.]
MRRRKSFFKVATLLDNAQRFLAAAAQKGAPDFAALLNPVYLNCVDASGRTALIIAAENGCSEQLVLLMKRGARLDHQDRNGNTALLAAAVHRHIDPLRKLLSDPSRGPNLLLWNNNGDDIQAIINQARSRFPAPATCSSSRCSNTAPRSSQPVLKATARGPSGYWRWERA